MVTRMLGTVTIAFYPKCFVVSRNPTMRSVVWRVLGIAQYSTRAVGMVVRGAAHVYPKVVGF